jgi:genetic interactor of prohibitins 3, mitochondrial
MRSGAKQISCSRLLRGFVNIDHGSSPGATLPLYLCPAAARCQSSYRPGYATTSGAPRQHRFLPLGQARKLHLTSRPAKDDDADQLTPVRTLPVQCAGCGALSQTAVAGQPGYFSLDRRAVKAYLGLVREEHRQSSEDAVLQDALLTRGDLLERFGLGNAALPQPPQDETGQTQPDVPFCDRCHNLIHHHTGTPIYHPTIEAIRETIQESPYKYNHVYHVLDAADFPMSLLPQVHQLLDLMPLRTKNRRSQSGKFFKGRKTEMSFIITRSDLLAPKKEQVDRLMPTLVEILRQALPRDSRHVRLGNVRCVSAKRSWWTKEVKEDIWKRGGAGWMVGKVNVGKSQLFDAVFPKGRMDWKESKHDISVTVQPRSESASVPAVDREQHIKHAVLPDIDELGNDSLLPPPQEETNFPRMPVVSELPGTTASPIRVPFGGGKGELIDLPGLERSELETWVREEHRPSLVMKARASPKQQVVKPGQSLLIGGFIRITPRTPGLIFLAYAFTPIEPHLTATEKAIEIQQQTSAINATNISVPGTGEKVEHAGSFKLQWDVTKKLAGPITRKDAVGLKVDRLPYRVLSLDILIEGCGWVEITAQVRTRHLFAAPPTICKPPPKRAATVGREDILQELDLSEPGTEDGNAQHVGSREPEPNWPVVDVFSPEGRFIGQRPPLNAWLYNKVRKTAETSKKRPRKSMTGAKRRGKDMERARSAAAR